MSKLVLSLFDLTGNMVKPWRDAGYDCMAVDLQSEPGALYWLNRKEQTK